MRFDVNWETLIINQTKNKIGDLAKVYLPEKDALKNIYKSNEFKTDIIFN